MPLRKKILIVDDSATLREHLRTLLEDEFDCVVALDGADGYQKSISERPAAVVTDLEMPGMDGVAFLRCLRNDARTQALPVVIITTATSVDKVNDCRALGCAGFVLKPVQKDYLIAKLRQITRTPAPSAPAAG